MMRGISYVNWEMHLRLPEESSITEKDVMIWKSSEEMDRRGVWVGACIWGCHACKGRRGSTWMSSWISGRIGVERHGACNRTIWWQWYQNGPINCGDWGGSGSVLWLKDWDLFVIEWECRFRDNQNKWFDSLKY